MSTNVDLRELAIDRRGKQPPSLPARRHLLTRYVLPLGLLAGFLSLVAWSSRDFLFPPKRVTVVPVFSTTAEVRKQGTPLFKAAGWIEPRPTPVRVAALAPGVVEKLLVVEDQPLRAGQRIAELVQDDAQLAFDRAGADLELRRAELREAQALSAAAETRLRQPVHLRAALGEAEASLAMIETAAKNLPFETRRAEADFQALQNDYQGKLAAKGVVAGVEIDIAKGKVEAARALVEELRDRADSLQRERSALQRRRDALQEQLELLIDETKARDEADAKIAAAKARLEQARLAVAQAKLQLDRMTIKAPIDGRVFRLIAHPGTRLGRGMTHMQGYDGSTVITMYRPDMLQVRVDVRFEDIPQVRLGQPVEIDNPALPSPLTGKVLFISSEADIQKNTLQVKVEIPDPPAVFKPEMLVDVTFLAPQRPERETEPEREVKLLVPQQLVRQGDDGPFLWLADQSQGIARRVSIQTGSAAAGGLIEVTSGLNVSSRIIAEGTQGLKDGDRIRVAGENDELGTHFGTRPGARSDAPERLPSRGKD